MTSVYILALAEKAAGWEESVAKKGPVDKQITISNTAIANTK